MNANKIQSLDIDVLKTLLHKHQEELEKALLDGTSWREVQKLRRQITELSILVDKRSSSHPAENKSRLH